MQGGVAGTGHFSQLIDELTLQHTATLCNTLKQAVGVSYILSSYSNTLQHTVTHCNTLKQAVGVIGVLSSHCNTLQHTLVAQMSLFPTRKYCNFWVVVLISGLNGTRGAAEGVGAKGKIRHLEEAWGGYH